MLKVVVILLMIISILVVVAAVVVVRWMRSRATCLQKGGIHSASAQSVCLQVHDFLSQLPKRPVCKALV